MHYSAMMYSVVIQPYDYLKFSLLYLLDSRFPGYELYYYRCIPHLIIIMTFPISIACLLAILIAIISVVVIDMGRLCANSAVLCGH